jgi:hypothetical protein
MFEKEVRVLSSCGSGRQEVLQAAGQVRSHALRESVIADIVPQSDLMSLFWL